MPQFDPALWPPQLIWLLICFVALYFLMARVALPRIGSVLEERSLKISDALRKAEDLKAAAEAAEAAYEKLMADARAKAQEAVRVVREQSAAEATERHAELEQRLSEEVAAAEARIAKARDEAVAGIRAIATDLTIAATERLIGETIDAKTAASAVGAALKEAG